MERKLNSMVHQVVIILCIVAAIVRSSSAFSPSLASTKWGRRVSTPIQLVAGEENLFGEVGGDNTFGGVDLEVLLGTKKFKKLKRKFKTERNALIREEDEKAQKAARVSARKMAKSNRNSKSLRKMAISGADSETESSENKCLKLIISGAPASGKGTQCEKIKERYGVVHLSTGDMLRAAVAAGTEVGKQAKDFMDSGKLVPDDVIIGIMKDRLNEEDCVESGWLLDGFPRTEGQAKALADAGVTADCFLLLNVPDDVLIERVVGRRSDPETGKIYHMTFSPPPEEIIPRLVQRSDDTEEKARVRLEQYRANVDAVKGSYSGICVEIDGTQTPDEVSSEICDAIEAKAIA